MLWLYECDAKLQEIADVKEVLKQRHDVNAEEYYAHLTRIENAYKKERIEALQRKQPQTEVQINWNKYDSLIEREVKWRHYLNM